MRQLITRLSGSAWLRKLVRTLRLHTLGNAWLRRFPLVKQLPQSQVIYRATRMESIPLAVEIFEKGNLYDATLLPDHFETFIDLGCNVGYFTCWLAHLAGGRKLKGLMLDANPQAVEEAEWHAQANQWTEVYGLHGLAGEGNPGDSREFFLYESNICSTTQLPDVEVMGLTGRWEKIKVPCLSVQEHWNKHFGDQRCNLLKIDIEGSELAFLEMEADFLEKVDALLVEWHKWRVTLDDLEAFLKPRGFTFIKTIEENDQMGTSYFKR